MDFNKLKNYPDLLELAYLTVGQRNESLRNIFQRDIQENKNFCFRTKTIRPHKKEGQDSMDVLLNHLTTKDDKDEKGNKTGSRSFEMARSHRLHWVKFHIEEQKQINVEVFSFRDRVKGRWVIRTYIYDIDQDYVVVLEPSKVDYYLLTAYYFNEQGGKEQIERKRNNKLPEVY